MMACSSPPITTLSAVLGSIERPAVERYAVQSLLARNQAATVCRQNQRCEIGHGQFLSVPLAFPVYAGDANDIEDVHRFERADLCQFGKRGA